ncbi:nostrin [Python bivittatus]|uniref:Nostrin n=1 Tax=Python bivittatus TaxID=176946 RepID=A0A9F2MWH0_PYTBI|nr:nostrin [Python bivittatus]
MKNPLADCMHDRAYQELKGYSKNGDNYCKQVLSILQQRTSLEITYGKGLEKLANKLAKMLNKIQVNYSHRTSLCVSEELKSASDLHRKLGKAIQTEAINPMNRILQDHEKKKKIVDNTVEKAAEAVISNWRQQLKAKKKLKELTKDHEALFRNTESSHPLASPKTKKKLLRNLEKSAIKLAKDDEDYYKKNVAACETRVKWEHTLENGHQSILDLEKERLLLLCNTLHRYSQLLSHFGQSLIACHAKVHNTVTEAEVDEDMQMLVNEMSVTTAETKLELLLTDYYEEDLMSLIEKERRQTAIKAKILRVQTDLEKVLQDKTGLERMLQAYKETPQFSDAKNINDITAQLSEATLKAALLRANHFKLGSVLAEIEERPKPSCLWNDISKWKEKDCVHSSVTITCPVTMRSIKQTLKTRTTSEAGISSSCLPETLGSAKSTTCLQLENGNSVSRTCRALYDYHTEREDELCLSKGDVIVIHHKDKNGWWYGSRNGEKGNFPATYVEEVTLSADRSDEESSL